MQVSPILEPEQHQRLPVRTPGRLPDHHAHAPTRSPRRDDPREPAPQVDGAAPAELRLVSEHPICEVSTRTLARNGNPVRPELPGQSAFQGFPGAVPHAPSRMASAAVASGAIPK